MSSVDRMNLCTRAHDIAARTRPTLSLKWRKLLGRYSALSFAALFLCYRAAYHSGAFLLARSCVLLYPQPPSRAQSASEDIFIRHRQPDVGHCHPSTSSRKGNQPIGLLLHELGLQL